MFYRSIIIVRLSDVTKVDYDPNEIIDYHKVKSLGFKIHFENMTPENYKQVKNTLEENDRSKFRLMKYLYPSTQINFTAGAKFKLNSNNIKMYRMYNYNGTLSKTDVYCGSKVHSLKT